MDLATRLARESTYVAKMIENIMVAELQRYGWVTKGNCVGVLRGEVDDSGFDLGLTCGNVTRFVQFKQSRGYTPQKKLPVHMRLAAQPSSCVVLACHNLDSSYESFSLDYYWLGSCVGKSIDLSGYKVATNPRTKQERPDVRAVPCYAFDDVDGISGLYEKLFMYRDG